MTLERSLFDTNEDKAALIDPVLNLLRTGQIVGLDPREMLATALGQLAEEPSAVTPDPTLTDEELAGIPIVTPHQLRVLDDQPVIVLRENGSYWFYRNDEAPGADVSILIAALRASRKREREAGQVVTHLGGVNLELRQRLAMHQRPTHPAPVCETCDCPLVLEGETRLCRTCATFDWLAH